VRRSSTPLGRSGPLPPSSNSGCNRIILLPGWAGTAIRPQGQNLCPVAHASRFSDGPPIFRFWLQAPTFALNLMLSIFARRGSGRRKPWQSMIPLKGLSSTDGQIATASIRASIRGSQFTGAQGVGNPGEAWLKFPCASRAGQLPCTSHADVGADTGAWHGRYAGTIRNKRAQRCGPRDDDKH